MAQLNFTAPTVGLPGQMAMCPDVDTGLYPAAAQVSNVDSGGTTDGTYTIRITRPDGIFDDASFVAVSKTAVQIAQGLIDAINALTTLRGIVVATLVTTDNILLTFVSLGSIYTVTFPSNPGTNLTLTTATSANVSALGVGIFVHKNADGTVRALTTTDTAADITGLVSRSAAEMLPMFRPNTQGDGYSPGGLVPIALRGDYWVDTEGAVTYGAQVYVRRTATGTEVFGAVRGDTDSGDAVPVNAYFLITTTGAGRSIVRLIDPVVGVIPNGAVQGSSLGIFQSTEVTGTGSSQSVAHSLGRTPTVVWWAWSDTSPATLGSCVFTPGTHTSTNVVFTATSGKKLYLWAL